MLLALVLAAFLLVPVTAANTYAAEGDQSAILAASSISGYSRKLSKTYDSKVMISAYVNPSNGGRKVRLQRYNSRTGKWKTIKTITTGDTKHAKVSFSIPAKYRRKTTSIWRIYAPATDIATSAKSKDITLTTRNLRGLSMSASASCIYRIDDDGKGTLIYTDRHNTKRAPASTTKIMTAVLLSESGLLDATTRISGHAAGTRYSSYHLSKGDNYRMSDLLYAIMLPSANDAAIAIAEKVGGSESAFVKKMNKKASKLGLKNTHFKNPHGVNKNGQYTTAYDLAKLTAYAYTFPEIRKCWNTRTKTIRSLNKKKKKWKLKTTNSIFRYVKSFLGGKTGTGSPAGCCFAGIYTYKGTTYVTVVLGSNSRISRWSDIKKLHKYIRKYAASKY